MQYFESHITIERPKHKPAQRMLKEYVENNLKAKYSQIEGDPSLGDKTFCYLTRHHRDLQDAFIQLSNDHRYLSYHGYVVVRKKIEVVVFDTKGNTTHTIVKDVIKIGGTD